MMQEEELFHSLKLTPHILTTGLHSWTCLEKAKDSITGHVWRVELPFLPLRCLCLFGLESRLESNIAGKQNSWDSG